VFDFCVVVESLIEFTLAAQGVVVGLSAIRAFRLVRFLTFFRYGVQWIFLRVPRFKVLIVVVFCSSNWKSMSNLLLTVIGSLEDFLHFGAVVLLFIFIFDIAGVQVDSVSCIMFDPSSVAFCLKLLLSLVMPWAWFMAFTVLP
jgi:hypothetical protein